MLFDLQSHSHHSDGALAPREVVANAAAAGVSLLALSDHDSVAGVEEAAGAAREHGIDLVTATEISTKHGEREDLHVLGYGVDVGSQELVDRLAGFRSARERRAEDMADKLRELGFELDESPIEARRAEGKSIGRPHLAEAVIAHPANAERLRDEGRDDISPFIANYLIAGKPGFVARAFPSVEEAIELIHAAGGVAIWAHPFWDVEDPGDVVALAEEFAGFGVDGIEAFYATHDERQTTVVVDFCEERGLLTTGSSDYHGPDHKLFSRFLAFDTFGYEPNLGPIDPR
jgi:predicted metal-dependent phosphoesterase TrpH